MTNAGVLGSGFCAGGYRTRRNLDIELVPGSVRLLRQIRAPAGISIGWAGGKPHQVGYLDPTIVSS